MIWLADITKLILKQSRLIDTFIIAVCGSPIVDLVPLDNSEAQLDIKGHMSQ